MAKQLTVDNLDLALSEVMAEFEECPLIAKPQLVDYKSRVRSARFMAKALGWRYRYCSFKSYEVYESSLAQNKDIDSQCYGRDLLDRPASRLSQGDCVQAVKDFCLALPDRVRIGSGLVLFGPRGTGKDHLMVAAIYWAILKHGYSVRWIDGRDLTQRLHAAVRFDESEKALVDKFVQPQILALSDPIPPRGDTSPYITEILQSIVDRRYRGMFPTWVTLNVANGEEAERRLSPPTVDRLRHDSLALYCGWQSYRERRRK